MSGYRLLAGDCLDVLPTLEAKSVQCVVTSPPYWGLRDYGVDGQLGLEASPAEYVERMVEVFREVRRVLRDDGTVFLNIGDSYAASPGQRKETDAAGPKQMTKRGSTGSPSRSVDGLKPKDLVGIPWRVAFALQADGWYLRSDIIWAKPNPMPESVTDRPTKSHEYVFLLSKSARYFFDADAVREGTLTRDRAREKFNGESAVDTKVRGWGSHCGTDEAAGRNIRTVWQIATEPYPEAHFATFPKALAERCVRAGSSERGQCGTCGAPYERLTAGGHTEPQMVTGKNLLNADRNDSGRTQFVADEASRTIGWKPTCKHDTETHADDTEPQVVLDPFAGSGTTGVVALRNGRSFVGIELNPAYVEMARNRIHGDGPLFNVEVTA